MFPKYEGSIQRLAHVARARRELWDITQSILPYRAVFFRHEETTKSFRHPREMNEVQRRHPGCDLQGMKG